MVERVTYVEGKKVKKIIEVFESYLNSNLQKLNIN